MRRVLWLLPALLASLLAACDGTPQGSAPAAASAELQLAKTQNCMACHAVDKKLVGPSFQAVAQKYAGQPDAVDLLANKVIKGGAGVWGPVPMPANAQVTQAQARQLVLWILATK